MPRLSFWANGRKTHDYNFIDRVISEYFLIGGTGVYLHKYIGPYDQTDGDAAGPAPTVATIEDVLFLENRNRQYDPNVYELRGIYNLSDLEFDLRQFGAFLQGDTLYIEFAFNDMISLLGRKIMAGDVIELPHQRDDFLLNGGPSINKFYTVEDASRAVDGYSVTWLPHIWRVKVIPMTASQEVSDILNTQAQNPLGLDQGVLGELMSTVGTEMAIDEAVVADAIATVSKRYFETQQFWMVPGSETAGEHPWVFAGDGVPPNGAALVGSGASFPPHPATDDYYLRVDYNPATLFRWSGTSWVYQETNWRGSDWSMAHRLLEGFLNNRQTATFQDGSTAPAKVNLSQAIKPRADF